MSQQPIEFFSIRPDLSRPTTSASNSKLVIDRDGRKPLFSTINTPAGFATNDPELSILGTSTPTKSPAHSIHNARRQRPVSIDGLRGRASAPHSPLQRSWSSANRRELGAITPEGIPIPRRRSSLASVTRHAQVISLTEAYRIALEEDEGALATDFDVQSDTSYNDQDYYDEPERHSKRFYNQRDLHGVHDPRDHNSAQRIDQDYYDLPIKDQRGIYDKNHSRLQRRSSPPAMNLSPSPTPAYPGSRGNDSSARSGTSLLPSSHSVEQIGTIKARPFQELREKARNRLTKSPSLTRGLRRSGSKGSITSFLSDDGTKSPASKSSRLLKFVPGLSREPSGASSSHKTKEKEKELDVAASPITTPSRSKSFLKRLVKRSENKDPVESAQIILERKKEPEIDPSPMSPRPPASPLFDQRSHPVQATPPSRPVTSLGHALTHSRSYSGRSPNSQYSWQVGDDFTGVDIQGIESSRVRASPASVISTPRSARSSLGPRDDRTLRFTNNRLDEIRALEKAIEQVNGDGNEYLHHHVLTTTTTILRSPEHRLKDSDAPIVRSPDRRALDMESLSLRSPDRSRGRDIDSPSIRSRERYIRSPDSRVTRDVENLRSPDGRRESERERREVRKSAPAIIMPLHELSEPEDDVPANKIQEIRQREIAEESRINVASAKLEENRELNSQHRTRSLSTYVNYRRRTAPIAEGIYQKESITSPAASPRFEPTSFETPPKKENFASPPASPQPLSLFEPVAPIAPRKIYPTEPNDVAPFALLRAKIPAIRNNTHVPVTPDLIEKRYHSHQDDSILEEDESVVGDGEEAENDEGTTPPLQINNKGFQLDGEYEKEHLPEQAEPEAEPAKSSTKLEEYMEAVELANVEKVITSQTTSHVTLATIEAADTQKKLVSSDEVLLAPLPILDHSSAQDTPNSASHLEADRGMPENVSDDVGVQPDAEKTASYDGPDNFTGPGPDSLPFPVVPLPESILISPLLVATGPQENLSQPFLTLTTTLAPIPGSPESHDNKADCISAPVSAVLSHQHTDPVPSRLPDEREKQRASSAHSSTHSPVRPRSAHNSGVQTIKNGPSNSLLPLLSRKASFASVSSDGKSKRSASASSQADQRTEFRKPSSFITRSASASTIHSAASSYTHPNTTVAAVTALTTSSVSPVLDASPDIHMKTHGRRNIAPSQATFVVSALPTSSLSMLKQRSTSNSRSRYISHTGSVSELDLDLESDQEVCRRDRKGATNLRSTSRASTTHRRSVSRPVSSTTAATEKLSHAISPPIIHQPDVSSTSQQMHSRTWSSPCRLDIRTGDRAHSPVSRAHTSTVLAPSPIPDLAPNPNLNLLNMHRRSVSTDCSFRARNLARNTSGTELFTLGDSNTAYPPAPRVTSEGPMSRNIQHVVNTRNSIDSPILEPAIVDGTPIETPRPPPISKTEQPVFSGYSLGASDSKALSSKMSLSRLDVITESSNTKVHNRRTASVGTADTIMSSRLSRERDRDRDRSSSLRRTSVTSLSEMSRTRSRSQPFRRAPMNSLKPPSVRDDLRELKRQYGVEDSTIDIDDYTELMLAQKEIEHEEEEAHAQAKVKATARRSSRGSSACSSRGSHGERNAAQELAACDKALQGLRSIKQGLSRLEHRVSSGSVPSKNCDASVDETSTSKVFPDDISTVESHAPDNSYDAKSATSLHQPEAGAEPRRMEANNLVSEGRKMVVIHQAERGLKRAVVGSLGPVKDDVITVATTSNQEAVAQDESHQASQTVKSTELNISTSLQSHQNVLEGPTHSKVETKSKREATNSRIGDADDVELLSDLETAIEKDHPLLSSFSSFDDMATLIPSTYTDSKMTSSGQLPESPDGISRSQAELRKRAKPVLIDVGLPPALSQKPIPQPESPTTPSEHDVESPVSSISTKYSGLNLRRRHSSASMDIVSVDIPVPRMYKKGPFSLTITGLFVVLLAIWYFTEKSMCDIHCRPVACSAPCVWQDDDPTFGYAIPIKVDQWVTGGKGRQAWNQVVQDASDYSADLLDWATGTDITAIDSKLLDFESKRQLRRRLRKKGLLKKRGDKTDQTAKHTEWATILDPQHH
ncbi:uncharacterized protein BROUX77_001505 [Berkeleyomyces rouxiae]|uniref:uncharacterized protein n=1 Tax=Berkeleyomyces rouxiae TaxID=2035830 RepID=UPI003B7CF4DC